jgi:hypothetical protein
MTLALESSSYICKPDDRQGSGVVLQIAAGLLQSDELHQLTGLEAHEAILRIPRVC